VTVWYCTGLLYRHKVVEKRPHTDVCEQFFQEVGASLGDGTKICCDLLEQARKSKKPCDPGIDLDCDGVPNQYDDFPFDPNCSRWGDPCSEKYKKNN
jgi:hypothetical protein